MLPSRRQVLQGTAAAATSIGLAHARIRWSPNEEIRVAVIGLRGRGGGHIAGFRRLPGVRVVALCDVDQDVLDGAVAKFTERGEKVVAEKDLRKILEREDVDVVSIATPNHWHALAAVWACQAGKDVYVEKPVSHNVWEGRQIVAAARKYGRIVQTGTQSRSMPSLREALEWVRADNLGPLELARGLCYKPRQSIGKVVGPQRVSASIDYDLWTGPAPLKPLWRKRLHYDWHWVFDTGNGDLGNQGIHEMDICRWAIGADALSPAVTAVGGRFAYADDANTPNTLLVLHEYEPVPLLFEVRGLPKDASFHKEGWGQNMDRYKGTGIGVVLHCEGGWVTIDQSRRAVAYDKDGKEVKRFEGGGDHYANFIEAVRSRRVEDLSADIVEGHLSSALCHLGNASYLAGCTTPMEKLSAGWKEGPGAEALGRVAEHLERNGVNLGAQSPVAGQRLEFDPVRERFRDANHDWLLRTGGRPPFVVPEEV